MALAPPVSDGSRENHFSGRLNPSRLWPSHVLVLESLIGNNSTFQSEVEKRFRKLSLLKSLIFTLLPALLSSIKILSLLVTSTQLAMASRGFIGWFSILGLTLASSLCLDEKWFIKIDIFPCYSFELWENRWICLLVQLQRTEEPPSSNHWGSRHKVSWQSKS